MRPWFVDHIRERDGKLVPVVVGYFPDTSNFWKAMDGIYCRCNRCGDFTGEYFMLYGVELICANCFIGNVGEA